MSIYHGEPDDTLGNIRLQSFHQKVSSSTAYVQPRSLPPTSVASLDHSLRLYHQVQQWPENDLPVQDWGWIIQNGGMIPISADLQPGPVYHLEAIEYNCKIGCKTRRCGYRKFGLQ